MYLERERERERELCVYIYIYIYIYIYTILPITTTIPIIVTKLNNNCDYQAGGAARGILGVCLTMGASC